jgi:hypothetical protein
MLGSYHQQALRRASIRNQIATRGTFGKTLEKLPALAYRSENDVVKKIVGRRISIETPAFDGVLTEVQSARTREFRWFIGLWAKFFSQGLLWSPRTDMAEQS